ncbi:MAG: hypothetical protein ACI4PJ_01345 [Acutalibacteraceae bacterium]
MKKRILSILLTFCMVLMLVPKAVFAANDDLQSLLTGGGTVTLGKDYTIDTTLDVTGKTVTLDLNGHTITMTGSGSVINVGSNGNLTVNDRNPTATHTGASLPAGGVITGGDATFGGGVCVSTGGSMTLTRGTIANCRASSGGGVSVNSGSFTMNGGTIENCSASSNGGGVYVDCGSMTLTGGTIENCSADDSGGGVYVYYGSFFTMTGGTIANCSATSSNIGYGGYGGGVYNIGSFTMTGGTIEACRSTDGDSDAVYISNNAPLLANGGKIKDTVRSYGAIQNTSGNSGCTVFYDAVSNYGTISGGIYYGGIQNLGVPKVYIQIKRETANT